MAKRSDIPMVMVLPAINGEKDGDTDVDIDAVVRKAARLMLIKMPTEMAIMW